MGWRTAHGSAKNAIVAIETLPPDELPRPNAHDMDTRLAEQKVIGRPFQKGNKAARGRRPKLANLGIDRDTIKNSKGLYSRYLAYAENYRQKRVQEMRIAHGFVSSGAASIMATSALCLAASRYLSALATQSDFPDLDLLKKSADLATQSRQNELAAWELCSREASAKTRAAANETPWLATEPPVRQRISLPEKSPIWEVPNESNLSKHQKADHNV